MRRFEVLSSFRRPGSPVGPLVYVVHADRQMDRDRPDLIGSVVCLELGDSRLICKVDGVERQMPRRPIRPGEAIGLTVTPTERPTDRPGELSPENKALISSDAAFQALLLYASPETLNRLLDAAREEGREEADADWEEAEPNPDAMITPQAREDAGWAQYGLEPPKET